MSAVNVDSVQEELAITQTKGTKCLDYCRGSENGGINGQRKHGTSWINEVKEEGGIKDEFKVS